MVSIIEQSKTGISKSTQVTYLDAWSETAYVNIIQGLEGFLVRHTNLFTKQKFSFKFTAGTPTFCYLYFANIYIGCNDGSVVIYCQDIQTAKFTPHKSPIVSIFVNEMGVYSCSEQGTLIHSSNEGIVVSSFDTGKTVSCAAFVGDECIVGDYEIHIFDMKQNKITNSFNGHTTRINSLTVSSNGYIVSSAMEDRCINVWGPVPKILTCDVAITRSGINEQEQVFGITEEGVIHFWDLNTAPQKKKKKTNALTPFSPSGSLTVTVEDKPTRIISARFVQESIEICYGSTNHHFERVSFVDSNGKVESLTCLTRSFTEKQIVSTKNPSKAVSANPIEKTFSEIIQEQEAPEAPSRPTASSLTTLLQQGLHTNDPILLQQAFSVQQPTIVTSTLQRLSVQMIPVLLTTLVSYLSKPTRITTLLVWLRSLLCVHTSVLTTHSQLLRSVQILLKERVKNYEAVHQLNGKLDLVLGFSKKKDAQDFEIEQGGVYLDGQESEEDDSEEEEEEEDIEYNEDFAFDSDEEGAGKDHEEDNMSE